MEWKDITTYSKNDEQRVPSVWNISIGGMKVCVHRYTGYAKDDWLLSTYSPGFFDSKLLKSKDIEKAKYEALMLVRDRANEISAGVAAVLMSEDKMKYVNANLKSYKEFIQRMLNGEVFYRVTGNTKNQNFLIDKYYFCDDSFIEILDGGGKWDVNPCKNSIEDLKIIAGDDNE